MLTPIHPIQSTLVRLLITIAIALQTGCINEIVMKPGKPLPPNHTPVIGRVKCLHKGLPVQWGDGGAFHELGGPGHFYLQITPLNDPKTVYDHLLTHDGTFYWQLTPGRYLIANGNIVNYVIDQIWVSGIYLGAEFEVPADNRPVYIGTLVVDDDPETKKHNHQVIDESDLTTQTFRDNFPQLTSPPNIRLMTVEEQP